MGSFRHPECQSEPPMSDVEIAAGWAAALEEREAKRAGVSLRQAREVVARKTGVPSGKLYSLRRGRLKDIARRFVERLGDAVRGELELELRRVEHELQTYRQIGLGAGESEMQSALASRARIRAALGLGMEE